MREDDYTEQLSETLSKLPDKVLHCLARTFQDEISGVCVKCLYCKYAPECAENGKKSGRWLFADILCSLAKSTGVMLFLKPENKSINILKGSWLENYPDLLKEFTSKSFEEQQDTLMDSDILQYVDNQ